MKTHRADTLKRQLCSILVLHSLLFGMTHTHAQPAESPLAIPLAQHRGGTAQGFVSQTHFFFELFLLNDTFYVSMLAFRMAQEEP